MKIILASWREIPPEISCHYTAGQAEMNREQDSDAAVSQRASLNSMKLTCNCVKTVFDDEF